MVIGQGRVEMKLKLKRELKLFNSVLVSVWYEIVLIVVYLLTDFQLKGLHGLLIN